MKKKIIQIFIGDQSDDPCGSGDCSCNCGTSGTSSNKIDTDELMKRYFKVLDGIAEFNVYHMTNEQEVDELIIKLNEVLFRSGEKLVVDKSNLEFVLSQTAPVIAVEGKIISMKNYPDEEELYDAVMSDKKIPLRKGCC